VRTLYLREDNAPRAGRADVTPVSLVAVGTAGPVVAYLGEVSGIEHPADCLHVLHLTDSDDPWEHVEAIGYVREPAGFING
jgi:hypothetical protein